MEVGLALEAIWRPFGACEARSRLLRFRRNAPAQSPVYDTDPVGVPEELSALPFSTPCSS